MNPTERRELHEEIRAIGLCSIREAWSPAGPIDLDAERAIVTTCWEGTSAPDGLRGSHFYSPLLGRLFVFATEMRDMGHEPRIERALRWLESNGFRAPWLAEEVDTVVNRTPTHLPLAPLGERIVRLARRREARREASRLLALLGDIHAPDEDLDRAISRISAGLRGDAS